MYNISSPYQPYQLHHQQGYTQHPPQIYPQNVMINQQNEKTLTYGGGSAILRNGSNSYKPLTQNQPF